MINQRKNGASNRFRSIRHVAFLWSIQFLSTHLCGWRKPQLPLVYQQIQIKTTHNCQKQDYLSPSQHSLSSSFSPPPTLVTKTLPPYPKSHHPVPRQHPQSYLSRADTTQKIITFSVKQKRQPIKVVAIVV